MTKEQQEVSKVIKYLQQVGFHFAKTMIEMVNSGEIKPPKDYSKEDYVSIIETAHYEGVQKFVENDNKKKKKVNGANVKQTEGQE